MPATLEAGVRSIHAGSYKAEPRQGGAAYVLEAASMPPSTNRFPTVKLGSQRRRGGRFDARKVLVLPALSSMDPLLAGDSVKRPSTSSTGPRAQPDVEEKCTAEANVRLPSIAERRNVETQVAARPGVLPAPPTQGVSVPPASSALDASATSPRDDDSAALMFAGDRGAPDTDTPAPPPPVAVPLESATSLSLPDGLAAAAAASVPKVRGPALCAGLSRHVRAASHKMVYRHGTHAPCAGGRRGQACRGALPPFKPPSPSLWHFQRAGQLESTASESAQLAQELRWMSRSRSPGRMPVERPWLLVDQEVRPTDQEFKEWLTWPISSASGRAQSVAGTGTDCGSVTQTSFGSTWTAATTKTEPVVYHVMLLRKTIQDSRNTTSRIVAVLTEVLGLEADAAERIAGEMPVNLMTPLFSCSSQSEAFGKVEELRDAGLCVQIASSAGLPAGFTSSKRRRRRKKGTPPRDGESSGATGEPAASYVEIIQDVLRRTDIAGKHKHGLSKAALDATQLSPTGRMSSSAAWRHESKIQIMPADPVEALFEQEERERAEEQDRRAAAAESAVGAEKMKNLVYKHQEALLQRASIESADKTLALAVSAFTQKKDTPSVTVKREDFSEEDAEQTSSKQSAGTLTSAKREVSRLLRFLLLTPAWHETSKADEEREDSFLQPVGSREDVGAIMRFMKRVDKDGSGRCDIGELRGAVKDILKDRILTKDERKSIWAVRPEAIPGWLNLGCDPFKDSQRFVTRYIDKLSLGLLGKKSSFQIEDLFRVAWPLAGHGDIRTMIRICKDIEKEAAQVRVESPPILDEAEFEGLCSVFRYFDEDESGEVSLDELVAKGLIYADQTADYRKDWDRNGDGCFCMMEFCEMMCPLGYRVHALSKIGSQKDGTRVIFDDTLGGWRHVTDGDLHPERE